MAMIKPILNKKVNKSKELATISFISKSNILPLIKVIFNHRETLQSLFFKILNSNQAALLM